MNPPGCGRGVDCLWALGQLLTRQSPSPVNSGVLQLLSTPPCRPHCPLTPQSNPNPSFPPVNYILYHEIIPTVSHSCSPLPCTPFSTGANPHSAGFSLIPPHHTHCLGSPQPVLINVCVWGGTLALGAGQVLHLANLAPGNKTTVAVRPAPQKMPPTTFQMALNVGAGIHPRPRRPLPGYATSVSEAQTMQCLEHASGARFSLK